MAPTPKHRRPETSDKQLNGSTKRLARDIGPSNKDLKSHHVQELKNIDNHHETFNNRAKIDEPANFVIIVL